MDRDVLPASTLLTGFRRTVTRARRHLLFAFAVGVLLMGLVPPYEAVYTGTDASGTEQTREMFIRYDLAGRAPSAAEGYAALFGTDGSGPPRTAVRVRIDAQRLVTQIIAFGILVVALYLMMPGPKQRGASRLPER